MGETFRQLAESGPLLLAVGAAALAGLVSFLSPCVLPLMPGYLSYVTGLAGTDLEGRRPGAPPPQDPPPSGGGVGVVERTQARTTAAVKGRVLAGTLLFIAGFTVVFVATAILFSGVGKLFFRYERTLEIVIGALVVVLGLGYLGVIPGMQREFRIRWLPAAGLLGAPVLGAVFALSWLPCTGPTLGAVLGMAATEGGTDRAVLLAVAYCLGLGIPFVVFGLGFQRLLGVFRAVRRNSRWVTRIGGALLIAIGLALITGGWVNVVIWLQTNVGVGEVSI
ncbi:cytochrome c biogenesis protein CcdA [Micromonospora tulbaghiae]|uniref:Cytochrome c biogenesis protein CcdA n=1 Tax=Micromonospora tulbaghiae TaxID=479978 RepID=A0AAW4JTI4_9ACTN|nr:MULTISPECIES: cytochrome c biogenesis protein CcdA [Micromonospora]KAB1907458.1 cytochrome c biogenesis protein CcdA [Micromonospora sp. AMSO1212t]MBO4142346.1 cytochrome c biogenesis protein CcdA [Micromonospora tulbaghiae]MDX5460254.1 cytochrome c biogenesis protein CcdA [Micromonospora tulbaghiae]